jgi:LmbE family N-acetylglucosaminyl deacetylase
MKKDRNIILAVGAHPDDIEIGCGGTLAKHIERGDDVYMIVMTNGERGNHNMDRSECLKSLQTLGIKGIFFGNFPDGALSDDFLVVSFIEKYINELGVNRVYTHSPNDRHQDHRSCSRAVSSAARKITEILLFQGPSTTSHEPHYFIELSPSNFRKKIDSVNCYESQISKGIVNPKLISHLAEIHGATCNKMFAEAFAINHLFKEDSDV